MVDPRTQHNLSRRGQSPSGGHTFQIPTRVRGLIAAGQAKTQKSSLVKTAGNGSCSMASPQLAVVRNLPKVYSPLYEMTNLMLPRDIKTLNAWNRHFYTTNPIVRNAISLHASYPISKFQITCEDVKIKRFFEDMFDAMGFRGVLLGISLEYWKLGEVFPYLELDEENGVWAYCFLHNPDFIRVKSSPLAKDPIVSLVPDDTLRKVIQGRNPSDAKLRAQLPAETIMHVMKGSDIPLPNFNVAHLKMLASDYDIRGTSIITSVYKDLMLYDKIREMQFAQADNMINPLTLVKLGDPNGTWRPSDQDIAAFQSIMEEGMYDPDFKIITHGAVNVERIGYSGTVLDTAGMWEAINKNLYTGLLAPEAILNGEGPNYATASIGLEVLRTRYERFREQLSEWIERKVMEPIAKLQDFYVRKGGERRLIVPKVVWNKINLRDMESYVNNLITLMATADNPVGKVSDETVFQVLDIDPGEEEKRLRKEAIQRAIREKEIEAIGKMSLEELRTLDSEKPIVDIHKGEELPTSEETEGEGGGLLGAGKGGLGGLGGSPPKGGSKPKAPKPSGGGLGGKPEGGPKPTGGPTPPPAPKTEGTPPKSPAGPSPAAL